MFESGDNQNNDLNSDRFNNLESEKDLENIDTNISPENLAIRKKQLEKILVRLIAFGLACGTILGIGTYYILSRLGLNKRPYELEQERIEREKQEQKKQEQISFQTISTFPNIPSFLNNKTSDVTM